MALGDTHVLAAARMVDRAKVGSGHAGAAILFVRDAGLFPWADAARPDGADIRASADAAGLEELPIDPVAFDGAAGTGLLAVRHPAVSDTADAALYFWTGRTGGETRPAVGAANGAHSVWQDFAAVWTGHGLLDRTGGGHDLTARGQSQAGATGGPLGRALVLPGAEADGFLAGGFDLSGELTDLYLYRNDRPGETATLGVLDNGETHDSGQNSLFWLRSDASGFLEANLYNGSSNRARSARRPAGGAWAFAAAKRNSANMPVVYNGGTSDKAFASAGGGAAFSDARIGYWLIGSGNSPMMGQVAFRGIYRTAASDALVDTFAAALTTPDSFTTAMDIDTGGGAISGAAAVDIEGVLQRGADGHAAVPLTGSYSGMETETVDVRYLPGGSWQTLDPAPAGGDWAGTLRVPTGGPYRLEVRAGEGGPHAIVAEGLLVGARIVAMGQSNMAFWSYGTGFAASQTTPEPGAGRVFDRQDRRWRAPAGAGEAAFVERLHALSGAPVGFLNMAKSSAGILAANDSGAGHWWDHERGAAAISALLGDAAAQLAAGCEGLLYLGGERDAAAGAHAGRIAGALSEMLGYLRERAGQPSLPMVIGPLYNIDYPAIANADLQAVRAALLSFAEGDPHAAATASLLTVPLGADGLHPGAPGQGVAARLFADAFAANGLGRGNAWRGPRVVSVAATAADRTRIVFTVENAVLAQNEAVSGFELSADGGVWVPVAAAVSGAGEVLLTHANVADRHVRYQQGRADVSAPLRDAAGYAAEPFAARSASYSAQEPGGEDPGGDDGDDGEPEERIAAARPGRTAAAGDDQRLRSIAAG